MDKQLPENLSATLQAAISETKAHFYAMPYCLEILIKNIETVIPILRNTRSEWVSVDERLPEFNDVIIKIVHDDNTVMYDIDKYCPSIKEWFYHKDKRVTAWVEIPPEDDVSSFLTKCKKEYDEHDFIEDANQENGRYMNICCECDNPFIGNKHRITCKACDIKQLTKRIEVLEEALKPFSHHDLSEILGGNAEGDRSIVFARNKAVLKIGDFKSAQKALEDK